MLFGDVSFTVASHAAWVPGIDSAEAWQQWVSGNLSAAGSGEPAVKAMPPMLRRRASATGKIALEAAYAALPAHGIAEDTPVVFASRHGECSRSVELLEELSNGTTLSPTAFSLSVHNANAGLFSIARRARGNSIAIAAGHSTVEHAVIEACGLLADGAPQVLLVAADGPLPEAFEDYADCREQPFGWAWLMQAADEDGPLPTLSLQWSAAEAGQTAVPDAAPGGIDVLRFFLARDRDGMVRQADGRRWHWMRHD
ncbi:beta-ketoacyl synthase chain length factor [Herbaspirillum sp. LeCh32-8]|uniref:beta-ketoacyl synthase chain length factor n=1 Tax=Herbaspirillum sp. LeCh32-8 TaxID=2821356 RepID=UPI001AE551C5|nr:beta-ketoacyl synthase chain length factor [Herbaspirillum sp. LeCh32-8]MBP0597864.1 beta-ketoacyl synthase chain length factor [Herbaspirillum sp. LeCh32-8]